MEKTHNPLGDLSDEELMFRTAVNLCDEGLGIVGAAALDYGAPKKEEEDVDQDKQS